MRSKSTGVVYLALWLLAFAIAACSTGGEMLETEGEVQQPDLETGGLSLPDLEAVDVQDGRVKVVATTGIIGDVVAAVAGEGAEVDVLMAPNQDPHGYQITAGDLRLVADADIVFVNGWQLEEGLIADLENAAAGVPIVPVSAGIGPRYFEGSPSENQAQRVDPHVWLSPLNVIHWVDNIENVLSTLDPGNADAYAERADDYRSRLQELDAYYWQQLEPVDISRRVLVTNHNAFGYFADEYGFTVVGTIIPGDSSLAEPGSKDLAALVETMRDASLCAIFVEHSASPRLASQLADELDYCEDVQIVTLYSGALGEDGSGAETYLTMMKANIDKMLDALILSDESSGAS